VGAPATFELRGRIVARGGRIANIGVHGKILDAYDTFGDAAKTQALKVILAA
jgi:hypothetical protein